MKVRFVVAALVVALAAFAATAGAKAATRSAKVAELPQFCIDGTYTLTSFDEATYFYPLLVIYELNGQFMLAEDGQDSDDPGETPLQMFVDAVETIAGYSEDEDMIFAPGDAPEGATLHTITFGACAPAAAPQAPPPNIFLCYSTYQTNPGVWSKAEAEVLLTEGYWLPYAVPGNVPGGTNLGAYHLVCNLAAGQAAGDSFVGGDGTVLGPAYAGDEGLYPKVGP